MSADLCARLAAALDVLDDDADAWLESNVRPDVDPPMLDPEDQRIHDDYRAAILAVSEARAVLAALAPVVWRWRYKDRRDARWNYQEAPFAWPRAEIEVEALCVIPPSGS